MTDGSALPTAMMYGMRAANMWNDEAGTNLLDSGAHFYEVYEAKDGGHIAVGAIIATKTRAEWAEILEPAEAWATAVYGFGDAHEHPHNVARGTFVERGGVVQPAPAPRFSRTENEIREALSAEDALTAWGVTVPAG